MDEVTVQTLDRRLLVVETENKGFKEDIVEMKQSQKETRLLITSTLITSVLGLVGIIASFMR